MVFYIFYTHQSFRPIFPRGEVRISLSRTSSSSPRPNKYSVALIENRIRAKLSVLLHIRPTSVSRKQICATVPSVQQSRYILEDMKKNYSLHDNVIAEERFRFYFLVFRNVGMSLISHRNSKIYALYSAFIVLCAYSCFVAMMLDLLNHQDDLNHIMENVQACTSIALTLWIHNCIR